MDLTSPEPARLEANDEQELVRRVRNKLRTAGFVYLTPLSESGFLRLAEELGPIIGRVEVRVGQGRSLLSGPAPIPFHTDDPEADTVGWWCVETASSNGENLLIDTGDLLRHLDFADLDELTSTQIYRPLDDGTVEPHPCLVVRDGCYRIYYAPWHLLPAYEPAQHRALNALRAYLRSRQPFVVRMRRGESLFVDNGRVLHGRTALPMDTRRHLRRVWIRRQTATG